MVHEFVMAGLSGQVIDGFDINATIENIKLDIRSDFVLAPHFNAVFNRAANDLWSEVEHQLRSGSYNPSLPITMSIPKAGWFSRPGSILNPSDRLVYQALADNLQDVVETALDRTRAFSQIPSAAEDEYFVSASESWGNFQQRVQKICASSNYMIKADVSHYFERVPQHHLINLLNSAGCPSAISNLLEEVFLSFQQRNSFGIIQGVYPSDVFGNFFLSEFDAHCEINDLPSARYVDDFYIGFPDLASARSGMAQLVEKLRQDGLHLNEGKSRIYESDDLIREETEIDTLFNEVRSELDEDDPDFDVGPYGFEADWEVEEDDAGDDGEETFEVEAAETLISRIGDFPESSDKIEKFVIPILTSANSTSAIDHVMNSLLDRPHNARLYFSYLMRFSHTDNDLRNRIEALAINDQLSSDHQRMFLLAALMRSSSVSRQMVNKALTWMQNPRVAKETRAMCAIFSARRGIATQKRSVRTHYEQEPSEYVRAAILYSARYFETAERRTCKRAWGGHNLVNSLITKTI